MCKNKKDIFPIILGIINFALLIPLLCMHFPRIIDSNLGFDYMGIIVGILSLLVTVLIGWNIYTIIDYQKEISKTKKELNFIKQDINTLVNKTIQERTELFASIQKDFALISLKNYSTGCNKSFLSSIFTYTIKSVICYSYLKDYKQADDLITALINAIPKETYNSIDNKDKIKIKEITKDIIDVNKLKNSDKLLEYIFSDDNITQNSDK